MSNAADLSSGFDSRCPYCRDWYDSQVGHNCQPTYPTPTVVRSHEPTLRQRYAMAALTGLLSGAMGGQSINASKIERGDDEMAHFIARSAFAYADAMIALERKP